MPPTKRTQPKKATSSFTLTLPNRCQLLAASLLAIPIPSLASNGILPTGFGVEAQGMGGADVALARDTTAVNGNPAGLAQIQHKALDFYISPFVALRTKHRDGLGNDNRVDSPPGFLAGGSYAQRLSPELVIATGVFIQGGTGFSYEQLQTGYGNRDDLEAAVGVSKIATAVSWQVDEKLSLGIGLGLSYAVASQSFFPNTSDAQAPFFGYELNGLDGFGYSGKLGLQYQLSNQIGLGLAYTSASAISLSGGSLTANFEAIGLDRVNYNRASLKGLAFGQQLELGLVWRPNKKLLLAMELQWIDWSSEMQNITLDASQPDNANAPERFGYLSALDWRDQYPISIGAMYQLNEKTWLRGGLSHARNPTPGYAQNPAFAVIAENQITFSIRRELNTQWSMDLGLEYQPYREQNYQNPSLTIGQDAKESNEYLWLHFMLSKRWG